MDAHQSTPLTHPIDQMLSYSAPDFDIDFDALQSFDSIDEHDGLADFDFSALLPTDPVMPSSPPIRNGEMLVFGGSLEFEIETQHFGFQPSPSGKGDMKQTIKNGKHAPQPPKFSPRFESEESSATR
jgi:hypothetical protein